VACAGTGRSCFALSRNRNATAITVFAALGERSTTTMHEEADVKDKLAWTVKGETFEDGSRLADWLKVYQSSDWHWQYDTHEMTFAIYEHDGQYWKLYHARHVSLGENKFTYGFGGVACRAVEVAYLDTTRSPHSSMLKQKGELEWIRTYEFNPAIHKVIRSGERNDKYGEPYEARLSV
jgi:hypothetical protein